MSIGKYSEATISRTDAFLDKFEDLRDRGILIFFCNCRNLCFFYRVGELP